MSNIITLDISSVNFNKPKFKMVGGLSLDVLKIKYNWFFNAQVENAIIGEDENGLVWYSGIWVCGTWENGTWYSGTWLDGRWKSGNMYSYDIDYMESLKGKLYINRKDITKTMFKGGTFEGGTFHYGIFGNVKNENELDIPYNVDIYYVINNIEDYDITGTTFTYTSISYDIITGSTNICVSGSSSIDITGSTCPPGYTLTTGITYSDVTGTTINNLKTSIFVGGDFNSGLMNSCYIKGGNFYGDIANNVIWYNGNWFGGDFLIGDWYNGNFFGGDFSNGNWYNGYLSTNEETSSTRFGINYKGSGANWYNGTFSNGQFHSGLNTDDNGNPLPSLDHSLSRWYNGTFTNGEWFGGCLHDGLWLAGQFYSGIIFNIEWRRGNITDCIWKNGQFINGTISGGIFENMIVTNAQFGYDI